jgi:O-methyltransferase involved in polyketide biosynthesis
MKVQPRLGPIEETLLIPLYGRAVETRKARPILRDRQALEMVTAIDYDFSKFDGADSLQGSVIRTAMLDEWVSEFLRTSPAGTAVEVGAGLNTRFERLDNGRVHWIDLDLPDAMRLRGQFFAETDRRKMLAGSVVDDDWLALVRTSPGPWFFAVEAVFVFLAEAEVRHVLGRIGREFPGALVAFDTANTWMVSNPQEHDVMSKMAARMRWACDDARHIEQWSVGVRLLESRSFLQTQPRLTQRMPFAFRYLKPLLQWKYGKWFDAYKVNLFVVDSSAGGA